MPSFEDLIKSSDSNPINAIYRLLCMSGNAENCRNEPNLENTWDEQKIINNWINHMGKNCQIVICATCGKKDILDNANFMEPRDFNSPKLDIFKVDMIKFNKFNSFKQNALHTVDIKGIKYHYCNKGLIYKDNKIDKLRICKTCWKALDHIKKSSKPPINTFARYDLGNIEYNNLPKLSYAEKLAISRAVLFVPIYHFRATQGVANQGIKGHVFGAKTSRHDLLDSLVEELPRTDLDKRIQLVIYGKNECNFIAKNVIRQSVLQLRFHNILIWLTWLKNIGNEYYINIKIPCVMEANIIQNKFNNMIDNIINNTCTSDSKIVNEMARKTRLETQDNIDELEEKVDGTMLQNVYLADQGELQEPMDQIVHKIRKKVSNIEVKYDSDVIENVDLPDEYNYNNDNNDDCKDFNDDNLKTTNEYQNDIDFNKNSLYNIDLDNFMKVVEKRKKELKKSLNSRDTLINAKLIVDNQLYDEYNDNYKMLSCGFPYLFPFGLSREIASGTIIAKLRNTWCLFYDNRIATDLHLIFLLFDQTKRHAINRSVNFRINRKSQYEKEFIDWVNEDDIKEQLIEAEINPKSKISRNIRKKINSLIQIIGRKIPWTIQQRADSMGKLYAMYYFFGSATHFITISPCMRHNTLSLRLAINESAENIEQMDVNIRSKIICGNPVAASHTFYRLVNKFFELIVGINLDDNTGKKMNSKNLKFFNKQDINSPFGYIKAVYGVIEEQTSANLHLHCLLFGAWNVNSIQRHIHKPEFEKKLANYIDKHISTSINEEHKTDEFIKMSTPAYALQSVPLKTELIKDDSSKIAAKINNHHHTLTCWKSNVRKCRLAMPQPISKTTHFTQITKQKQEKDNDIDDDIEIEILPKISEPCPYNKDGNPFYYKDNRIIVPTLKRIDDFEQYQPEHQPLTTSLARCNTSTQVLITCRHAKAAMFYLTKYVSKIPYELHRVISLMLQSRIEYEKYGSTADDKGAPSRTAKNLLQKVLNKSGIMEISDQQAAAAVLGHKSNLCSHEFVFINVWAAIKHYKMSFKDYSDNVHVLEKYIDFSKLEFDELTGKAFGITQYQQYLDRGKELKYINFYCYVATITIQKKTNKNIESKDCGRKQNRRFQFNEKCIIYKSFEQTILCNPKIVRPIGRGPPKYPGNIPQNEKDLRIWLKHCKEFILYYSLLFLPINEKGLPFDPTKPDIHILPWKEIDSWKNFWIIFGSWDVDVDDDNNEYYFKRKMFNIFRNMVDSFRLSKEELTLPTKWRFRSADTRPDIKIHDINGEKINNNNNGAYSVDDLAKISEIIKSKHGADEFLDRNESALRKANKYLNNQIFNLRQIDGRKHKFKKKKKYVNYNFNQVKKMLSKIKENEDTIEILNNTNYNYKTKEYKLKDFQKKAIDQLRDIKNRPKHDDNIKSNQLLAFLQGNPGSGKSYTAKALAKQLGLNLKFSGTTHTAAKILEADTINSVLNLGRNRHKFSNKPLSSSQRQSIINKFENIDCLIIDEVSMLTPVSLAQIDKNLRQSLNNSFIFGGLDIILIGDMWQFNPVQPGLSKPALYQAIVKLAQDKKLPNEAYEKGAKLFSLFKLVLLEGQVRANNQYNNLLARLRNPNISQPITINWLDQFNILTKNDIKSHPERWLWAPIIVSGNMERRIFIKHKVRLFANITKQPILRWLCKVQKKTETGQIYYETLNCGDYCVYDELEVYFVRGAECYLTKSVESIRKATEGTFVDVIWKDNPIDIDALPIGKITTVKQPDYIIVKTKIKLRNSNIKNHRSKTKNILIPIPLTKSNFKDKKNRSKMRVFEKHECEISFSITYHRIQGVTKDSIILSLNSRNNVSSKIYGISLTSLYVGLSRVHSKSEVRILPYTKEDAKSLCKLQHDPLLLVYFKNYDKNGNWSPLMLKKLFEKKINNIQLKLGMIDFNSLIVEDLKYFTKELDIIVESNSKNPVKSDYLNALKNYHKKGTDMLFANDKMLFHKEVDLLKSELKKKNISKMSVTELKYYVRRLNIKNSKKLTEHHLRNILFQLVSNHSNKYSNLSNTSTIDIDLNNDIDIKMKCNKLMNTNICKFNMDDEFKCVNYDCDIHKRKKTLYDFENKVYPTKFGRSLNVCWVIASIQLLSSIDWPNSFYMYSKLNPTYLFVKFFKFILTARCDISGQIFNAASVASNFIKKFKTDLLTSKIDINKPYEEDWNIDNQHDASEFIRILLVNITMIHPNNSPKAFFKNKLSIMEKEMVEFINDSIKFDAKNKICCYNCNQEWYTKFHECIPQIMLNLSIPNEQMLHQYSIQNLLDVHFATEKLFDYTCKYCNISNQSKKQCVIIKIGKYFIINLKRYRYVDESWSYKITDSIYINDIININVNKQKYYFKLISTVNHVGDNFSCGHYTTTKYQKSTLFLCDDADFESDTQFNENTAYIFLYKQTDKECENDFINDYNNYDLSMETTQHENFCLNAKYNEYKNNNANDKFINDSTIFNNLIINNNNLINDSNNVELLNNDNDGYLIDKYSYNYLAEFRKNYIDEICTYKKYKHISCCCIERFIQVNELNETEFIDDNEIFYTVNAIKHYKKVLNSISYPSEYNYNLKQLVIEEIINSLFGIIVYNNKQEKCFENIKYSFSNFCSHCNRSLDIANLQLNSKNYNQNKNINNEFEMLHSTNTNNLQNMNNFLTDLFERIYKRNEQKKK